MKLGGIVRYYFTKISIFHHVSFIEYILVCRQPFDSFLMGFSISYAYYVVHSVASPRNGDEPITIGTYRVSFVWKPTTELDNCVKKQENVVKYIIGKTCGSS